MKKFLYIPAIIILLASHACTNNDETNQLEIIGSWELAKIEDSQNGTDLPPNDGKPVQLNFKNGGGYDGTAGNNEIRGEYKVNDNTIVFTLFTTEIIHTEWESMFMNAINKTWSQNEYIVPYTVEGTELILPYEEQSKMFFVKIQK